MRDFEILFTAQNSRQNSPYSRPAGVTTSGRVDRSREFHPECSLQFLHMLAGRGLADAVHGGAPAEAVGLGDVSEKL